ncbi:MAG: glycosyltransferase family 2 protein [Bacteroidales bacterium]|nr:glycosyltransferase family 2 protein [Bacteroidales bacterium]
MTKLVSIIVPIYNSSAFLRKCIDSLVSQSYKDIEIVLFDDGSRDDSFKICNQYAAKDNRIKVFSRENRGVSQTRLDAFHNSTGEYITFVDADDYVEEDYVSLMVKHLERENVDVVSSQHNNVIGQKIDKDIRNIQGRFDKQGIENLLETKYLYDSSTQKTGITVYLCTKLIKREFVEKILNASLGLWYGEDQVAVTQLLYDVSSIFVSQDYTYNYVHHLLQVTQQVRIDYLHVQSLCWQRLLKIDEKTLLKNQLPQRMMLNINRFLMDFIKIKPTYIIFKQEIKSIRMEKTSMLLFSKKTINLSFFVKILFFMIKYKLYLCAFLYLNVKQRLKGSL